MARGREKPNSQAATRYLKPLREYVGRRVRFFVETEGLDPTRLVAEELVNETIAAALRRRDGAAGTIDPSWLRHTARGLIGREVERLRKAREREVSLDIPVAGTGTFAADYPGEDLTLADLLADTTLPLPAEVYEQGELWDCVDRTFAALPPPWREIFFLHAVDGLTVDEVAALEGRPVEAIIHSVSQTREHLREALVEEFGELLEAA